MRPTGKLKIAMMAIVILLSCGTADAQRWRWHSRLLLVFHPFSPKEETDSFSHVERAFANLSQEDQAYLLAVYQEDIFMNE